METILTIIFLAVLCVIVSLFAANKYNREYNIKILEKLRQNYHSALNELKMNPTSADLKQNSLLLGRKYSALTRQIHTGNKSVTIYDEMALLNDINAASAGATIQPSINSQTPEERLENLSTLNKKGLITLEEYEIKRQQILEEI